MQILYLEKVDSTHIYLKEYIAIHKYIKPIAIVTSNQLEGIGSRNNNWDGKNGNLFFSFVIDKKNLPNDLKIQSASIYFSYILKDILVQLGSNIVLKWPNDFYCGNKKTGGTITTLSNDLVYCGIGLNLIKVNDKFGFLDIDIDIQNLLELYFIALEKYPSWKHIFSKYKIEFNHKNDFEANIRNKVFSKKVLLKNTILQDDGSLLVDGNRVFSLR